MGFQDLYLLYKKERMLKCNAYILMSVLLTTMSCKNKEQVEFDRLNESAHWNLQFSDPCTGDWQTHWLLDGEIAKVENSENGMNFSAGPVNRDDAHHAVLWTQKSFKGDVKIEYDYTRTDGQKINVNILYIQANGIGKEPYAKDISKWADLRKIPSMSIYYNNMNALHISYAAFNMTNDDPEADYIRVRKYPVTEEITFDEMEVPPSFEETGLFLPGETYRITVIKTDDQLFFQAKGKGMTKLYYWELKDTESVREGRIGLRHMFTRSAQYSNVNISVKE